MGTLHAVSDYKKWWSEMSINSALFLIWPFLIIGYCMYSNKRKIMEWKIYLHFRVAFGVIWLNHLKYFLPIQQRKCVVTSLVFSYCVSFSSFWYPSFKLCFKILIFSVRYFFSFIDCSLSDWFILPLIEPKNDHICSLDFHEWYKLSK